MEHFLNRLDIFYYNLILTNDINKKELILNKILLLLQHFRITMDMFNFLHKAYPQIFIDFINQCGKPSLILMVYDLNAIGKAIGIPDNTYICTTYNSFRIEYNNVTESIDSSDGEWN